MIHQYRIPSIEEINEEVRRHNAKILGPPDWQGNCHMLAHVITLLVDGATIARGHWYGPLKGFWEHRAGMSFVAHSWALAPDKETIIDPTRWSFENAGPYVFTGKEVDHVACDMFCGNIGEEDEECHCGHHRDQHRSGFLNGCKLCLPWPYDEGGNRVREASLSRCPKAVMQSKHYDLSMLSIPAFIFFRKLVIENGGTFYNDRFLSIQQLMWLANLPATMFGEHGAAIARWFVRIDQKGLFPTDNFNMLTR